MTDPGEIGPVAGGMQSNMPVEAQVKVCVVTVTYGERAHLLSRVVEALTQLTDAPLITAIVVVDNGAHQHTKSYLARRSREDERVRVITKDVNEGSASGFRAGIEAGAASDCTHIWLLDDDNKPDTAALSELLRAYANLRQGFTPDRLGLLSLRTDREPLVRIAGGHSAASGFPRPSSFLGLDLVNVRDRMVRKARRTVSAGLGRRIKIGLQRVLRSKSNAAVETPSTPGQPIAVPYGLYGGLFFHKSLLKGIGLPDERMFVYADDSEFTARITRSGGRLFLIPTSRIDDLDQSWHVKGSGSAVQKLLNTDSDFRVFYSVRNRVYFENRFRDRLTLLCVLNRIVFTASLYVAALSAGKRRRLSLIRRAISDGQKGKLGIVRDLRLEEGGERRETKALTRESRSPS